MTEAKVKVQASKLSIVGHRYLMSSTVQFPGINCRPVQEKSPRFSSHVQCVVEVTTEMG